MASSNSRYGLFIPKKTTKGALLKPSASVFGDDSDEDSGAPVAKQAVTKNTKVKKQTQLEIDKALQEDPSVYQYDDIYDNIQAQKVTTEVKEVNKGDKKPKYIIGLLKMAEVRKREEEKRVERKVQKERVEEGNQFADKEAFVTSAYKKKMQEQQEQEERERREAAMEEILDVTKQKDLSGFYRYLYRETTGKAAGEEPSAEEAQDKNSGHKKTSSGSDSDSDRQSSDREVKPRKQRDAETGSEKRRDGKHDTDKHIPGKSLSSRNPSKSDKSSRRRSTSREVDHKHRSHRSRSRSPRNRESHHRHRSDRSRSKSPVNRSRKHRQRSRSRDGTRNRSPRERTDRRSHSRERSKTEQSKHGKDSKVRSRGSRERSSSPKEKKEASSKMPSSDNDTESKQVMLPARPPAEDLDGDDGESQAGEKRKQEAAGGQKKGQASDKRGKETDTAPVKFAKKTTAEGVSDARQKYLARKLARERVRPVVEPE